jgi:phospholipid/cholesterol/gamma-HCH transport system ATP-binding protein
VTRVTVDELIETLKRELKLTSLVISHDIGSALRLADQICFLSQGRMIFQGSPEAFVASPEPAIQKFLEAERHGWRAFQRYL